MTQEQWTKIDAVLRSASLERHAEASDEWFSAQTACYLCIWRILFPHQSFPKLVEPKNPYASNAVGVEKVSEYRPTTENVENNMKDAFKIVIKLLTKFNPKNARFLGTVAPSCIQASIHHHMEGRDPSLALIDNPATPEPCSPTEEFSSSSSLTFEPQTSIYSMNCPVSNVEAVGQALQRSLQLDQVIHIKVSSASFDCLAFNPETVVFLLRSLRMHQDIRPDQVVDIEVMPAQTRPQPALLTPAANCGGTDGDPVLVISPASQASPGEASMTMPPNDQTAYFSPLHRGEWVPPPSPSMPTISGVTNMFGSDSMLDLTMGSYLDNSQNNFDWNLDLLSEDVPNRSNEMDQG
ncbi:hypothetical protein PG984_011606 [Apiospora sp. TS-2023a]